MFGSWFSSLLLKAYGIPGHVSRVKRLSVITFHLPHRLFEIHVGIGIAVCFNRKHRSTDQAQGATMVRYGKPDFAVYRVHFFNMPPSFLECLLFHHFTPIPLSLAVSRGKGFAWVIWRTVARWPNRPGTFPCVSSSIAKPPRVLRQRASQNSTVRPTQNNSTGTRTRTIHRAECPARGPRYLSCPYGLALGVSSHPVRLPSSATESPDPPYKIAPPGLEPGNSLWGLSAVVALQPQPAFRDIRLPASTDCATELSLFTSTR